ncbi:MAG: DUF87 domain-containing protein [Lentisphaerales bacterium]|nr:DUF87 domain-containing protein [Lentisphaerales bacterium]
MSKLLKPSALRAIISELNDILAEYANRYSVISQNTKSQKKIIKSAFENSCEKSSDKAKAEIKLQEKSFLDQKHKLEKDTQSQQYTIAASYDEKIAKINQTFAETSETTRRYSAEAISEKRHEHDTEVDSLKAETEKVLSLLGEHLKMCEDIAPLLKQFDYYKEPKDKVKDLLESTDEVDSQKVLSKYDTSEDYERLNELTSINETLISKLNQSKISKLFVKINPVLIYILIVAFFGAIAFAGYKTQLNALNLKNSAIGGIIGIISFSIIHLFYKINTTKKLLSIAQDTAEIQSIYELCKSCEQASLQVRTIKEGEKLASFRQLEENKISSEIQALDQDKENELQTLRTTMQDELNEQKEEAAAELNKLAENEQQALEELEAQTETEMAKFQKQYETSLNNILSSEASEMDELNNSWQQKWFESLERFEELHQASLKNEKSLFPSWNEALRDWLPPTSFSGAIPFGQLQMDLTKELIIPQENCLDLKEGVPFAIPALLEFPEQGSLCVSTKDEEDRKAAIHLLQNTVLRTLMTLPPGRARFNFIDPLSLGETFAGFMHLNDYKEDLTGGRIATNSRQIEKQLTDLNEHMEIVIQKYLRNEFQSINEYNEKVGEIAEPYRFLIITDFPVNFSEESVKRLISILKSGAKCGVYVIMHRDTKHRIPGEFSKSEIEDNLVFLEYLFTDLDWRNSGFRMADFTMESFPEPGTMNDIIKKIGAASIDATRVEIPFSKVQTSDLWQQKSANDLSAAIGLSGAKNQLLSFGHGTSQHCLIAGKTGSGKSNLMHVMICNLALNYSPDELEFYLIDFKKGVEFKAYATANLPHAKAIAIESDREFGLSVLRKIDADLQERGELLRKAGAQNIVQYRKTTGNLMSRILLIIDEFQEIFVEDDMIAQEASLLLDRIVRQGRAFGMHVILGSQTLAGSYSLPRATMGQMTIRIALQCSESDSYVILSESNNAARLLNRPGEAIYNDQAGLPEGNNPFQAAYMPESEKDTVLEQIKNAGDGRKPYVFEGNIPADIRNSKTLNELATRTGSLKLVLGEPNAIRDSQSLSLENMPGQNVLITGQKEEAALSSFTSMILSAAKQIDKEKLDLYIFDGSGSDLSREDYFFNLFEKISTNYTYIKPATAEAAVKDIHENKDGASDKTILIFILGLHRFRKLKNEDNFSWDDNKKSAGSLLGEILSDGPSQNIHTVCWVDSWNSFNRMAPRKALNDYVHRILFQMSQSDSISLIDNSDASKLGLHTAILFDDQSGEAIKYRPFSLPNQLQLKELSMNKKTR